MLNFDECDQLLVTNPFADGSPTVSPRNNHDILPTALTLDSPERDPLRNRSVSPARRRNIQRIPSVDAPGGKGEARARLMGLLSLDESSAVASEDRITGSAGETPRGGNDTTVHTVGPQDSFASVALRHGVSIAALRRANQLWPSDPIHLRTELFIPRGQTLRMRHKRTQRPSANASSRSTVELPPVPPPDLAASLAAARNMILSVLPARISLDSLSSKATASEDHELDDLQTPRAQKMSTVDGPFAEDGFELSILAAPRAQHKLPAIGGTVSSQITENHHIDASHVSPIDASLLRPASSSPSGSLRTRRTQPFAGLPVRTSQLEPEPAMELPVRRPRR